MQKDSCSIKKNMTTVQEIINSAYDKLFDDIPDDDLEELLIEYKERSTGLTIRRSWRDREKRLIAYRESP